MKKTEIINQLALKGGLTSDEASKLFDFATYKTVIKNKLITTQGSDNIYLILIKSGCLMTFHEDKQGFKHVLQFGTEMWWTGDLEAFFNQKKSNYSIKTVVDSEVFLISPTNFELILKEVPSFERYFRILFQNALVSHQKRIIRNISLPAEERYKIFTGYFPKLELIVPQKYIASYLGITPEFLSKMKKGLLQKS